MAYWFQLLIAGLLLAIPQLGPDTVVDRAPTDVSQLSSASSISTEPVTLDITWGPIGLAESLPPGATGTSNLRTTTLTADFDLVGLLWDSGQVDRLWVQTRGSDGVWREWSEVPVDADHDEDQSRRGGSAPVFTGLSTAVRFVIDGTPLSTQAMLINSQSGSTTSFSGVGPVRTGELSTESLLDPPEPNWPGPDFIRDRSTWDTSGCRNPEANLSYNQPKALVIHHTAGSNSYSEADVPGIISAICTFHVTGRGWDDIGYNFLVDKYGNVWEGRTSSKTSPVQGAHTAGYNSQTQGVAMLGTFSNIQPSQAQLNGLTQTLEWLTGWYSIDPTKQVTLSAGASDTGPAEGTEAFVSTVLGHRDLGSTSCPGGAFYSTLANLRLQITPVNFGFQPSDLRCNGQVPTIFGTPGNDRIYGTDGPDVIVGITGNDWVSGQDGDDMICGDDGDDIIFGGLGDDWTSGGTGDDACSGEARIECERYSHLLSDVAVFSVDGSNASLELYASGVDHFDRRNPDWWINPDPYDLNNVDNRFVAGDFNADGTDDIAVFYNYGSGARIHTFLSNGTSFNYQGSTGWWKTSSGYNLNNVDNRFVAGDFNADGTDDIAVFYNYGSGARIHTFLSNGTSFNYQGSTGWWKTSSGYNLNNVDNRFVAGDFNADGTDDIAVFYNYGSGARIHTFLSNGTSFNYQGSTGWWKTSSGYNLNNVDNRFVAGDFNADGTDDIAVFYNYGSGARIHTFLSNGTSFNYQGSTGWWKTSSGYNLNNVDNRFVAGDFNADGTDDIAVFYNYGSGARIHTFLSNGTSFNYQGSTGWWRDNAYSIDGIGNRFVAGTFDGS